MACLTMFVTVIGALSVDSSMARQEISARDAAPASTSIRAGAARQQQRTISGTVRDPNGEPIPYANVLIDGARRTITTDSGTFTLSLAHSRSVGLAVRRLGYREWRQDLNPAGDTTVSVVLEPTARRLETSTIVATPPQSPALRINGFYDRMRDRERGINNGFFLSPEDIEQRNANMFTKLLEGVPGMQIRRVDQEGHGTPVGSDGRCSMTVFLDGRRLNSLREANSVSARMQVYGNRTTSTADAVTDLDVLVLPKSVGGVEVYRRPGEAPAKYQMLSGTCGVILIWTK